MSCFISFMSQITINCCLSIRPSIEAKMKCSETLLIMIVAIVNLSHTQTHTLAYIHVQIEITNNNRYFRKLMKIANSKGNGRCSSNSSSKTENNEIINKSKCAIVLLPTSVIMVAVEAVRNNYTIQIIWSKFQVTNKDICGIKIQADSLVHGTFKCKSHSTRNG